MADSTQPQASVRAGVTGTAPGESPMAIVATDGQLVLAEVIWSDVIADDLEATSWQDRALCSQTDPEAFFPEKGGSTREAKKVCRKCSVRTQCLEYALDRNERFGIWGGLSEQERRRLGRAMAA